MYHKLAVPLDGSSVAETALPFATRLAALLNVRLLLLQVVGSPRPDFTLEQETQHFKRVVQYLEEVKSGLVNAGAAPEQLEIMVVQGKKEQELAEITTSNQADLIVMTTYGNTALARLVMGSVAANLIKQATLPVVLIRPAEMAHPKPFTSINEPLSLGRRLGPLVVALDGIQKVWLATSSRDFLIQLLPVASPLIGLEPEIGPAFSEAFNRIDQFLQASDLSGQERRLTNYVQQD